MNNQNFRRTRFEWLDALSASSSLIKGLAVKDSISDATYSDPTTTASQNADAFNLSNDATHNSAVVETVEQLAAKGVATSALRKLLVDLTSSNTYGAFSELAAYRFLLKGGHDFNIQAPMAGNSILNPKGSDLDGVVRLPENIYFDAKGFGFLDHLVVRLTKRLTADLTPDQVFAEKSWDVSVELLNELLGKGYVDLLDELRTKRRAIRDVIQFNVRPRQRVSVSGRIIDRAGAASKNAEYLFRFAKQFTRNKPFFLLLVIHPWFSHSLQIDFDGSLELFAKELSRNFFCHFEADTTPIFGTTRAAAARLLSGIVFVDAWELPQTKPQTRYRLCLNPNATNKPKPESIQAFAKPYGPDIAVEQIKCR